jgi:YaaC-like Protein
MAADPREGEPLLVRKRALRFSFFPMIRNTRRWGLGDALFAMSPWAVMDSAVRSELGDGELAIEAAAFLEQARDFYEAATDRLAANPLLLYYAFLNLGKALLLVRGHGQSLERATHGLSEQRLASDEEGVGLGLDDSVVVVQSRRNRVNVFAELLERLGYERPADDSAYPVSDLLSQVVIGHRLWREADRKNKERFVGIDLIEMMHSRADQSLWLRLYVEKGDLQRYGFTKTQVLEEGGLTPTFREVKIAPTGNSASLICLEQAEVVPYNSRPSDVVMRVVDIARQHLWRIVSSTPESGYRKYYLHLSPAGEARLPQIASLWVLFFYFGSIVRYRPHLFDDVSAGKYGAFIAEFVSAQADQLLYLLASEMCGREVARPAIV